MYQLQHWKPSNQELPCSVLWTYTLPKMVHLKIWTIFAYDNCSLLAIARKWDVYKYVYKDLYIIIYKNIRIYIHTSNVSKLFCSTRKRAGKGEGIARQASIWRTSIYNLIFIQRRIRVTRVMAEVKTWKMPCSSNKCERKI